MKQLALINGVLPVRRDPAPRSAPRAKTVAPREVKNLLTPDDLVLVSGLRERHEAVTISGLREAGTEAAMRLKASILAHGGGADEIDREAIKLCHALVALLRRGTATKRSARK